MILLLDNYDSFTYNLAQYVEEEGEELRVARNDKITVDEILESKPSGILLSPGPCVPQKAGICLGLIREAVGRVPIFGVCLGMQAIGEAMGAKVVEAGRIMHGKISPVSHDAKGVFRNVPSPFDVIRYHSLVLKDLPSELEQTAISDDGEIMGVRHLTMPIEGVQFHPESILTQHGKAIIRNWLGSL